MTKGSPLLSRLVLLPTGTKGSPTSYYKRITSSTLLDVLCRWDGEEATREAGGHEFESPPCTRIYFAWKITWLVTCACVRASRGFSNIFCPCMPPLYQPWLKAPPLVPVRSPRITGPLLSLIINPGWNFIFYTLYQPGPYPLFLPVLRSSSVRLGYRHLFN
jgi:hypothetical protein